MIADALAKGIFGKRADGAVTVDLGKLGEKVLLRKDGTSVYITQDIGTTILKHEEHGPDTMIWVVGDEQNLHFRMLFTILGRLGYSWADSLYHLSYGMVNLPSGRMKSREGTVVDADDLIEDMYLEAKATSEESGKLDDVDDAEKDKLYHMIGLGALKYFILKVDPRKKMLFNPKESIDFNGNTGPFIQYTHARICSILRKASSARASNGRAMPVLGSPCGTQTGPLPAADGCPGPPQTATCDGT